MRILVFEDNLMWSSRLVQTLKGLGHEPVLSPNGDADFSGADAAIVNLGSTRTAVAELVPRLKAAGIHVIGHAGHKETERMALGKEAGCDTLVSNSELTFKIEAILKGI